MTATIPSPSDTQASGPASLSEPHVRMHGRALFLGENVLAHGADPTGSATSDAAFQAAADAVAAGATQRDRTVWVPGGSYKFADATGVTCSFDNVRWVGIGNGTSGATISVKNAYAFTGVGRSGNIFENICVTLRSGTTSGGAWSFTGGGDTNGWVRCTAIGVSGFTGSLFKRTGAVFDYWHNCTATGPTGYGYDLQAGAGFMNHIELVRCKCVIASVAGTYISGGRGVVVDSCDYESNTGYGVYIQNTPNATVKQSWFESNYNDNCRIDGGSDVLLMANNFESTQSVGGGGSATANHITLTGAINFPTLLANWVTNAANQYSVEIGASVDGTLIEGCRGFGNALISDSGTNTRIIASGAAPLSALEGGYRFGKTRGMLSGAGTPEGSVTADIGSLYLRTNGGANTTLYIKESGAGNTGWVAK